MSHAGAPCWHRARRTGVGCDRNSAPSASATTRLPPPCSRHHPDSPTRSSYPSARRPRSPSTPTGGCSSRRNRVECGSCSNGVTRSPRPPSTSPAWCAANSERGLLGIALDPERRPPTGSSTSSTRSGSSAAAPRTRPLSPVNRVSRFTLTGDTIDPASELVLVDGMPSPNGNHNAGDVHVGNDGNLYVSIGDGGCDYAGNSGCAGANDAARDLHALTGKIVRITRTGGIPRRQPVHRPRHRPVQHGLGASRHEVPGDLRHRAAEPVPVRVRPHTPPNVTSFRINDVGQNTWEEIDVGLAGADYGWNVREGHCATGSTTNCGAPPAGMTNPIHDYDHSGGCASITGGAFVPVGVWPASFDGDYLFSDYVCGTIFRLEPDGAGGYVRTPFVTGLGANSAVHLGFGPFGTGPGATQALYYTTYAGGGQVRRISPACRSRRSPRRRRAVPRHSPSRSTARPAATPTANRSPTSGPSATTRRRRRARRCSTRTEQRAPTPPRSWSATAPGTRPRRRARSSVSRRAATRRRRPRSDRPPSARRSPSPSRCTLNGRAIDAQDGKLQPGQLSWLVLLHHVPEGGTEHTHPLASGTGASLTFAYPAPEDLAAAAGSWVEAILTATDSGGASASVAAGSTPSA